MKKLDLSPITSSVSMPLKKGSLQLIQDAYKECFNASIMALIGSSYNPSTVYVLFGVINSGSDLTYNISEGAVFRGGEIFLVDAVSFTVTVGNVAVYSLSTTFVTATDSDPVTLTDATTANVHQVRKLILSEGASGSGLADIGSSVYLPPLVAKLNPSTNPVNSVANILQISGTYPNLNFFVPASANAHPVVGMGSVTVGNPGGGGFSHDFTFDDTGADYTVLGTIIGLGTEELDTTCIWTVSNISRTGFRVHIREVGNYTQNINFEYVLIAK